MTTLGTGVAHLTCTARFIRPPHRGSQRRNGRAPPSPARPAIGAGRGTAGRAACPQPAAAALRTPRRLPSPRPTRAVRIARVPVSCPPSCIRPRDYPPSSLCRPPLDGTPSKPAAGRQLRGRQIGLGSASERRSLGAASGQEGGLVLGPFEGCARGDGGSRRVRRCPPGGRRRAARDTSVTHEG
jgi:hypothetical protein